MKGLAKIAEWFVREPRRVPGRDRFEVDVVSPAVERFSVRALPFEIRFACGQLPGAEEKLRAFFERGFGIGIRRTARASEQALAAAESISNIAQAETFEPWCSRLVFHGEIPVFSEDDITEARARGANLLTDAHVLLSERFTAIRFIPVDLFAHGVEEADVAFIAELNRAAEPVSAAHFHRRLLVDRRADLQSPFRVLLVAALAVAPFAHALEAWVAGFGRLFAAFARHLASESSELVLLKSSGYTPRQLFRQGFVYLPMLVLGVFAVVAANARVAAGASFAVAGFLFGAACVAFPFTRLLQRFAAARTAYDRLRTAGKASSVSAVSASAMAARDLAVHPDVSGSAFGILATPFISMAAFAFFPHFVSNGWLLAFLASADTLFASIFVISARACVRASVGRRVRASLHREKKE